MAADGDSPLRQPLGDSADGAANASRDVHYVERLRTPWWWYLVAMFIAALFAAEFHFGRVNASEWLPFVIMLPLAAVLVWSLGRSRVEVAGGELRIRGAHLPLQYVSGVIGLDAMTLRRVVGREGDPEAFISIRPWIGPGVQVWIDDDDDPTPYWVVSSRHPDRLVKVLRSAL